MGKRLIPPQEPSEVQEIALRDALEERYLAYALSTIMNRAVPDALDGLKPVHRRILYGMRLLRLDPGAAFKKSAKIVGDVMGNFHPHGDQAIYDALVRLAQDFAQRYPLIDGQGNFGTIDGDNPAAMRYTEARMTEVARLLLDGIDEDAVDFRASYDGQSEEPVVLPAAFPNLLANGSQGIAVGMATSIPPHNAAELCAAALYLIDHKRAKSRELMGFVPGPDFPTGGIIVDSAETLAEAYANGRGSFRVRARWEKEETGRGTYVIVVTEIPWLVQKSRLIERIAELLNERKLPLLADVRDESTKDVRLVLEPRARTVDPALLMESLFKLTELESRIALNMNVLVKGRVPRVIGLAEALREWLDHRREVLLRRSRHRLAAIEHRLEALGGYLVAYLNIDKVIKIIREEAEREPVTIVVSEKGWIRALRGHVTDLSAVAFKTDDRLKLSFFAETTSKCLVFATNGRFYTLEASKLPGGRGHGEPIRLFVDIEQEADVVTVFPFRGGRKFLVASRAGRGFVVPEDECVANTRKGKQVLNVDLPDEARAIAPVEGELVASVGENRKMVIFPLDQVPEMGRGRGVRLQRYKDGGLSDIKIFEAADGLTWIDPAGRTYTLSIKDRADWRGNRADAGRLAPKGFPKTNRFGPLSENGKD